MSYKSTYTTLPYPWMSQSRYKKFVGCPYQFKRMEIDGYNPEESKKTMRQGTVLHDYFYMFFDNVDFDYLWDLGTDRDKIRFYFLTVLRGLVPVEKITDQHFIRNFKAFAKFELDHYLNLRHTLIHKIKVRLAWWCPPSRREIFTTNDTHMMCGTVDRILVEGTKRIIMDYKTGTSVPKAVRDEAESADPLIRAKKYTSATISIYTVQATFYAIIDAYIQGFHFAYDSYDKNGDAKWEFYRGDKKLSIGNYYEYIFLWTGFGGSKRPVYFMAYKKVHIKSVRAILNRLPKIRATEDWKRKPNIRRCDWCPIYHIECKDKIQQFKLFNGDVRFELY